MNTVSLHPYFKAKEGKLADLKALCPKVISICENEEKCISCGFTFNGDIMFCRESYEGAAGVFEHLEAAGAAIGEVLKCADLEKLEIHGPADELEQLKEPLKDMNPIYFTLEFGA